MATLRHFTIFAQVARHGNFTKAAHELKISQPSISRQLKILEQWIGIKLYRKTNKGITLTESGRLFLRDTEAITSLIEKLRNDFSRQPKAIAIAGLKLGGTYSLSAFLIPSIITAFEKSHRDIDISLRTATRAWVEEMLLNSEVEIALVSGLVDSPQLVAERFRTEKLVPFVSSAHILARKNHLLLEDLEHIPLIIRGVNPDRGATEQALKRLKQEGFQPRIALRCDSPEAVKTAVKQKAGVGILHCSLVEPEVKTGELKILNLAGMNLEATTYIVYQREKPLSEHAREFLEFLDRYRQKSRDKKELRA